MTLSIRPATLADTAAVDALLERTYPRLLKADYPPSVLVGAIPAMTRAQPKLMTSGTYYLAQEDDGRVLGAGGWTPNRGRPGWGDIRHVVTDDRALRRGIGRALMEHSFKAARAAGIGDLECWATLTAVPFYEAVGFRLIGPMTVRLQGAIEFPAMRMERSL
ncbi:MAG: GNAT family N-acetyltransferase [Pseudomonadota bacterium]